MNWAIAGVLFAVTLILSIVNATRVENLRTDLNNASGKVTLPETESVLIRGASGRRLPKKAYWVEVHPPPASAPGLQSGEEELAIGDGSDTDGSRFDTDVLNGRITHVYRADQRTMFSVRKEGGKLIVTPVGPAAGVQFVEPGTAAPRKMTIIGLPEALVTATASPV